LPGLPISSFYLEKINSLKIALNKPLENYQIAAGYFECWEVGHGSSLYRGKVTIIMFVVFSFSTHRNTHRSQEIDLSIHFTYGEKNRIKGGLTRR
jgi:hypothetical protein